MAVRKAPLFAAISVLLVILAGCADRQLVTSRPAPAEDEAAERARQPELASTPGLRKAAAEYQRYVEGQTELLVRRTEKFSSAVERGDLEGAQKLYATSRVPYEKIEPVAESFGNLDPRIDARENDVPSDEWTGFHRIEHALWAEGTTRGMDRYARELLRDTRRLEEKVRSAKLQPSDIVFGSVELLNEVSSSKITGEEERYSHTDLYDIAANVAGSEAAFRTLEPVLREKNPDLARKIEARFAGVEAELEKYRRGDGWVGYQELSRDERRRLSQRIDALAEPLSRMGEVLAKRG